MIVRAGKGLQEERKFGKGTQLITVTVKDAEEGRKFGKGSQFIRIASQHNQIGRKRRKFQQISPPTSSLMKSKPKHSTKS
jgi:hypothetical protein